MSKDLRNESVSAIEASDSGSSAPSPLTSVPSNVIDPNVVGVDPSQYNLRNPAVKRLMREAAELATPNEDIYARPLEDNLFEWHFTIRGASDSDYARGVYHGRIILPPEYPMKPPSIILLTPNGRFETGTKICLSISSYHPETWRPSWSIRTALVALISFMTTDSPGAIGSLEMPSEARQVLARKSLTWECPTCGPSIFHIRYVCSDQSNGPPKPQQLFRLPHQPRDGLDDVIPPEVLTRNQPNVPHTLPADGRAGDSGSQIPIAPRDEDDEGDDEEDVDLLGLGNGSTTIMTFAIGSVAFCIAGILIRRFISSGWWDVFG